jgi:hypothetical protein
MKTMRFKEHQLETIRQALVYGIEDRRNEIAIESVDADVAKEDLSKMKALFLEIHNKLEGETT